MDRTIAELSAMLPDMFLTPENFYTPFDIPGFITEYDRKQYEKGMKYGLESNYITISVSNVWECSLKNGGSVSSYETIGYHSGTHALLRGFIDSGCSIKVYRYGFEDAEGYTQIVETMINERHVFDAIDQSIDTYMYA